MNMFEYGGFDKVSIVIYGAGNWAKVAIRHLKSDGANIMCCLVSHFSRNPFFVEDIPVYEIDEQYTDEIKNYPVLVCVNEIIQSEVAVALKERQFERVYWLSAEQYEKWKNEEYIGGDFFDNEKNRKRLYEPYVYALSEVMKNRGLSNNQSRSIIASYIIGPQYKEKIIARLVVTLGNKCSLRCKDCSNLIPYFENSNEYDWSITKKAIVKILNNVHCIPKLEFIGGEPFLMKNLYDAISFAVSQDKVLEVEITTNGMIIPSINVLEILKDKKVIVKISDYGSLVDKSKLTGILSDNGVKYEVLAGENWILSGDYTNRHKSTKELVEEFYRCWPGCYCKTLLEDKVFHCARASSLWKIGIMKENDFLAIDDEITTDEIIRFWKADFSYACNYCDYAVQNPKIIKSAIQL